MIGPGSANIACRRAHAHLFMADGDSFDSPVHEQIQIDPTEPITMDADQQQLGRPTYAYDPHQHGVVVHIPADILY